MSSDRFWKPIALVTFILLVVVLGAWFYGESAQRTPEEQAPPEMPSPASAQAVTDLWFDPSVINIGDKIGAWTVAGFEYAEPGVLRSVRFSGSAEVSGQFTYAEEDAPFYAGSVFFMTSEAGAAVLPRSTDRPLVDGDGKRYRAFIFFDEAAARQAFGAPGNAGKATVQIKDYEVTLMGGEATDTAKLVRVIQR